MGWDKGISYQYAYSLLLRNLKSKRTIDLCYSAILLIQLRNGLRISESIESFKNYLRSRKNEIYVRVRKKKHDDYRLVVIPRELEHVNVDNCVELVSVDDKVLRDRVRMWFYKKYKLNTHSLRYSFITYLLQNNVSESIISKITHHSNLNYVLRYTQQRIADDVLRSIQ